jgi:uncharacterized protein (DUF58 family)
MKHRWPLIVIPLLILAVAFAGGFTMMWRFFFILVIVFGLMGVWSQRSLRGIDVRVKKTTGGRYIGDFLEEEFTITNNSRLPLSLVEVRENTDLSGDKNSFSFNLAAHGSQQWRTRHYFKRRGQYRVGVLDVKVTDPLGLIANSDRLGDLQFVTVYPVPLELPYFQIIPRQEPGQNLRRWFASESGPSASRVREYVSGDSLRHIHWQTTAHTGQLVVKEFDPDRSRFAFNEIWLVPDMSAATRAGEGQQSTEEYTITLAASLAKKYIENEKRVGLIASGDQPYMCLAQNGSRQLLDILRALALMKADGKVPIDDLLTFQAERFTAGSVVVAIMPSHNKSIVAPLRQAVNRGVTVIVILLDSMSFGGKQPAADTARSLMGAGFHVYVVRRGQDIPAALDSRWLSPFAQYAGERAIHVPS